MLFATGVGFQSKRACPLLFTEGVYDDPRGGALREKLYARFSKNFMFAMERRNLFSEVHTIQIRLNVYGGPLMPSSTASVTFPLRGRNDVSNAKMIESPVLYRE
jgi:hypothetical protein